MTETTIEIKRRKCSECGGGNVSHSEKVHALGDFCLNCMTCGLFFREDGSKGPRLEVGRKYLYVPEMGGVYTYIGMRGLFHSFRPVHSGDLLTLFSNEVMEQIVIDDIQALKSALRGLMTLVADEGLGGDERYRTAAQLVMPGGRGLPIR